MITRQKYETLRAQVIDYYDKAGIALTEKEKANIEVADFGLGDPDHCALQLVIYINTDRVCAKEETFRCRFGTVYLYVEGAPTPDIKATVPQTGRQYYTVFHEIVLKPGEQYTIPINTRHWFQAGNEGAVVSEFSTPSFDDEDVFTNPDIKRAPEIAKEA